MVGSLDFQTVKDQVARSCLGSCRLPETHPSAVDGHGPLQLRVQQSVPILAHGMEESRAHVGVSPLRGMRAAQNFAGKKIGERSVGSTKGLTS